MRKNLVYKSQPNQQAWFEIRDFGIILESEIMEKVNWWKLWE